MHRCGERRGALEAVLHEQPVDVLGGLLRARDEGDLLAHHVGDRSGEQRVVGAAEDQGVDAGGGERVEVLVRDLHQLRAAGQPGLDELDEPWARPGVQLDVRSGGERVVVRHRLGGRPGADHPDATRPGRGDGAPGRGVDHLDDRHRVALAGVPQHRGAGGVAGDDQRLHALVDEVVEALEGVLADLADRLRSVGLAGGVTEVEHRLVGQLVEHRPGHGESTEA